MPTFPRPLPPSPPSPLLPPLTPTVFAARQRAHIDLCATTSWPPADFSNTRYRPLWRQLRKTDPNFLPAFAEDVYQQHEEREASVRLYGYCNVLKFDYERQELDEVERFVACVDGVGGEWRVVPWRDGMKINSVVNATSLGYRVEDKGVAWNSFYSRIENVELEEMEKERKMLENRQTNEGEELAPDVINDAQLARENVHMNNMDIVNSPQALDTVGTQDNMFLGLGQFGEIDPLADLYDTAAPVGITSQDDSTTLFGGNLQSYEYTQTINPRLLTTVISSQSHNDPPAGTPSLILPGSNVSNTYKPNKRTKAPINNKRKGTAPSFILPGSSASTTYIAKQSIEMGSETRDKEDIVHSEDNDPFVDISEEPISPDASPETNELGPVVNKDPFAYLFGKKEALEGAVLPNISERHEGSKEFERLLEEFTSAKNNIEPHDTGAQPVCEDAASPEANVQPTQPETQEEIDSLAYLWEEAKSSGSNFKSTNDSQAHEWLQIVEPQMIMPDAPPPSFNESPNATLLLPSIVDFRTSDSYKGISPPATPFRHPSTDMQSLTAGSGLPETDESAEDAVLSKLLALVQEGSTNILPASAYVNRTDVFGNPQPTVMNTAAGRSLLTPEGSVLGQRYHPFPVRNGPVSPRVLPSGFKSHTAPHLFPPSSISAGLDKLLSTSQDLKTVPLPRVRLTTKRKGRAPESPPRNHHNVRDARGRWITSPVSKRPRLVLAPPQAHLSLPLPTPRPTETQTTSSGELPAANDFTTDSYKGQFHALNTAPKRHRLPATAYDFIYRLVWSALLTAYDAQPQSLAQLQAGPQGLRTSDIYATITNADQSLISATQTPERLKKIVLRFCNEQVKAELLAVEGGGRRGAKRFGLTEKGVVRAREEVRGEGKKRGKGGKGEGKEGEKE